MIFINRLRLIAADWLQTLGLMASILNMADYHRLLMWPIQIHSLKPYKPTQHSLHVSETGDPPTTLGPEGSHVSV